MNTLRHSKTWLSFVLLITVLIHFGFGHQDVSSFVLCFGSDGHVAVEHIAQDHDAGGGKASVTNYSLPANHSPCTSPCADIPLDGDTHTPLPLTDLSKIAFDIGFLPLFFLVLLIYYPRLITRQPPFPALLFTDSRLLALRSTVLLI